MIDNSYPKEVQVLFNKVIPKIVNVLNPEFILIAGSFGKRSWLFDKDKLLSDFEFEFICKKQWSRKRKAKILKELNKDFNYQIDLKGHLLANVESKILSNFAYKNPGYISLNFFDSFYEPQILYSKNNQKLPVSIKSEEIAAWEAWRLYINRIGELLEQRSLGVLSPSKYFWVKIFESTADAYLIINDLYDKNINSRVARFNRELIENDKALSPSLKKDCPMILEALASRQKHDIGHFKFDLSFEEGTIMMKSWLQYFQKELLVQEGLITSGKKNFYNNYLKSFSMQGEYLEFTNHFRVESSNLLRLIKNPKLVNSEFKFYNFKHSWRHIVLLTISSFLDEYKLKDTDFGQTKKILKKILRTKKVKAYNETELLAVIIKYWKFLR